MKTNSQKARLIHTPYQKPDAYHALSMPVYHAVAYEFDTAEEMEKAFCGQTNEHTYSRITNPTVQYFEDRIQIITGANSVTALNSGMAAISNTFLTIACQGSNIVTSRHLFGNTYSILASTLASFGVEVRFCDLTKPEEVHKHIDQHTCALFLEIITNPQLEVADLKALSAIARTARIPLIADTTIVPLTHFRASDFGVDIEIISSTKYISGGATSLGGLILDYQTTDWSQSRMLKSWYERFGEKAFATRLRKEIHRNLGSYMSPQVAYMQSLGLETLEMRYREQASTCLELASQMRSLPGVEAVNYPGLQQNPFYALSYAQFGSLPGAMFTFNLASRKECFSFLNRLKMIRRATNLFDNRSLAIHPASTIYGTFTEEQRQQMDVSPQTIRLSVGLEPTDDLLRDIRQALLLP